MAKVLGIDLGTTNSCMAVYEAGEVRVLENAEGMRTTPSVVAINPKTGERYVGILAKRQAIINPENTIFSVKRLMGRKFNDPSVQYDRTWLPYKIVEAPNGDAHVVMGGKTYSPIEISAMILQKLKMDAEARLGEKITKAVITVPAYFDDAQRQATKDAGTIAGLEVLRIINEPTAAALAYGFDKKGERLIAVCDLGGGTYDVSILQVGEGVFEVKATCGDTHLGGDDFDQRIIDWLCDKFKEEHGIDLRNDRMALQRLKEAAEKAKCELSTLQETEINLPFITADASGPKHLVATLTRSQLERLCSDLIDKLEEPARRAMADAKVTPADITDVILVGGMTRMPAVIEKFRQIFGKDPLRNLNPDEVVAMGAAIQGAVLAGEVRDILLLDVVPLTLSIETLGGVATPMIPRNTTIPTSKTEIFTTAADNQTAVEIHVVQGERPMAKDNKSIARFILDGIPPAPRGVPRIEVTFEVDANGILSVRAKDLATGREQKVVCQPSSGLSREEVERLVKEAERYAEEDRRKKEEAETRNQADSLAYTAEKMLRDYGDKIPASVKSEVQSKIDAVKRALSGGDIAEIRRSMQELQNAMQKIGLHMYGQAGGTGPGTSSGGETIEGEFREI